MEPADPLFEHLPEDQVKRVMIDQMADIAPEFLGFLDIYRALASIIPRHWTVVDLGCAYAPQSFLFEDHAVLKWAENNTLIARAPHIERPPKPDPKEYHITRAEAAKLLECANAAHIALAIRLLLSTGARNTAALELTWDRVDLERRIIKLKNPFDQSRRKGRATVPINDQLFMELSLAKKAALSPFVIEWAGKPVGSIKKGLKAAAVAAGLPEVSPHVLRHSAAVWLAEDGHPMSEIAQFLGHSNSRITERIYARFSPDHLRSLASSLEF